MKIFVEDEAVRKKNKSTWDLIFIDSFNFRLFLYDNRQFNFTYSKDFVELETFYLTKKKKKSVRCRIGTNQLYYKRKRLERVMEVSIYYCFPFLSVAVLNILFYFKRVLWRTGRRPFSPPEEIREIRIRTPVKSR